MPRSKNAKEWKPDTFGQDMINRMAGYLTVAEDCSEHLRSLDFSRLQLLWSKVQAEFSADPVKYPTVMVLQNDEQGREQFRMKCQTMCFPDVVPHTPEDHIRIIFGACAGLQSLTSQDLFGHPYLGEIQYRAHLQMLRMRGEKAAYEAAIEFDRNVRDKPIDLIDETIRCRDETLGAIVEYTVVDCGTSVRDGDYFVLQDDKGVRRQVTPEELHEIRVD